MVGLEHVEMKILQALLMVVMLAGCGYRGPLYLPGQEPVKKRRAPPPTGQTETQPAPRSGGATAPAPQQQPAPATEAR